MPQKSENANKSSLLSLFLFPSGETTLKRFLSATLDISHDRVLFNRDSNIFFALKIIQ